MSGGSYDYLCFKGVGDLVEGVAVEQLDRMADRLAGLPYASDVAAETAGLVYDLRAYRIRIEVRLQRLQEVWRAVEWWDSGDYVEDQVKDAVAKYRGDR